MGMNFLPLLPSGEGGRGDEGLRPSAYRIDMFFEEVTPGITLND
jgi:hypothetical protein